MKTLSINGDIVEAGTFVLMKEQDGWPRPIGSFGSFDGAMSEVRRLLEADASQMPLGIQPGFTKLYVVPVEHIK